MPQNFPFPAIVWGILSALLVTVAVRCLPVYLCCLQPRWIRPQFEPAGRKFRALAADPDVQQLEAALCAAGFRFLGRRSECWHLFGKARALDFLSPDGTISGSIARIGGRCLLNFFTPLEPGAFALTSNGRCRSIEHDGYAHTTLPGATFDDLLLAHRDSVQRLIEQGHTPVAIADQPSRLERARQFYRHPAVRQELRENARGMWAYYVCSGAVVAQFVVALLK